MLFAQPVRRTLVLLFWLLLLGSPFAAPGAASHRGQQGAKAASPEPARFGKDDFYGGYYTVEGMESFLDQEVAAHPILAEKVDVGDSWCKAHAGACVLPAPYNGYDLWAMHITNRGIPGPKPVFWLDAGIHAREIATPEVAMQYIDWLLSNYATNADAHWLVDYHDVWVMPMMNPDGHHIVEAGGGGNNPYYQRKNANNSDGCSTWPPVIDNHFGVDLNRNFPFMWNCCGGSTNEPCDQNYHGSGAASENETQAVVAKIRELIDDQRGSDVSDPAPITATGIYQDLHSHGSVDMYPWGFLAQPAPNDADLANIARHMSSPDAGGNGYPLCNHCATIVDGSAMDWPYGELGAASFTTEVSGDSFFPPHEDVQGIWDENRGMLLYMAKIARTPYLLVRGPDANSVTSTPMTVTQGASVLLTSTINYNWAENRYVQNVAAAEYYIDVPPWAGGVPVSMSPIDGSYDSATEGVQASVQTLALPLGRHIAMVRGRGVNDYEGYQSWGPFSATFIDVVPQGISTPTDTATPSASATTTPIATGTETPTNTAIPTSTSTATSPVIATATATPTPTAPALATPGLTPALTVTARPTLTLTPTARPCTPGFSDVHPQDYFYAGVGYLYCQGAISGYSDGTFRPYNNVTRGQLSKIIVLAEGWPLDTTGGPHFNDVPPDSPFYFYVETAHNRAIVSGYTCGAGCLEFRPGANATRAQSSKIIVGAQGWQVDTTDGPHFGDVPMGSPFYEYVETAYNHGIISGYTCGAGCLEFRPWSNATRGQISKIVYNAITEQNLRQDRVGGPGTVRP